MVPRPSSRFASSQHRHSGAALRRTSAPDQFAPEGSLWRCPVTARSRCSMRVDRANQSTPHRERSSHARNGAKRLRTLLMLIEFRRPHARARSGADTPWRLETSQAPANRQICKSTAHCSRACVGVQIWTPRTCARLPELCFDDRSVSSTRGGNAGADVWCLIDWSARHCARRRLPLRKGQVVTTGSWSGVLFASLGTSVPGQFVSLRSVSCRL